MTYHVIPSQAAVSGLGRLQFATAQRRTRTTAADPCEYGTVDPRTDYRCGLPHGGRLTERQVDCAERQCTRLNANPGERMDLGEMLTMCEDLCRGVQSQPAQRAQPSLPTITRSRTGEPYALPDPNADARKRPEDSFYQALRATKQTAPTVPSLVLQEARHCVSDGGLWSHAARLCLGVSSGPGLRVGWSWPVPRLSAGRTAGGSIRGLGQPPGFSLTPPYCGDPTVLQQMLYDLGYYPGPMDGDFGTNSLRAMATFKREEGLGSGVVVRHDCERIMDRWNRKMAAPATSQDQPSTERPMPDEFYKALRVRVAAPAAQQTMDQKYDESPIDTSEAGMMSSYKDWWADQSTVTKAAVIGGSAAVVGGVIYLAVR